MFLLPGGSEQALIDAINATNSPPTPLAPGDLYFGKITKVNGGEPGEVTLPVVAMYNSKFEGYLRFNYNRIDIGKVYGTIKPQIRRVGYPSLYRLLPIINETLGLDLSENDVVDVSITWLNDNEQINIPIVTKTESPAYEGQFVVEYQRVRPDLATIVFRDLDVMKHPISPSLGKKSLAMFMWSMDFTDFQNQLQLINGTWRDIGTVRQVMAKFGLPNNWPQVPRSPWISVQATKDVPSANKDFTHVIIHRDITFPDFAGDGYIHFNRS
jgi:hypothetical protein